MKIFFILFFVTALALLPIWPYSLGWGYASVGWLMLLGFILLSLHRLQVI